MQNNHSNVFTRPDTFFGVCEALGQDLRIHGNVFRLVFAGLLFWNPPVAIGTYAGAGLLVAATRWLYPNPKLAAPAAVVEQPITERPAEARELAEPALLAA